MIGLAWDGANVMTCNHNGIGILIEKEVEFEVHWSCCGLHQRDPMMKVAFKLLMGGEYISLSTIWVWVFTNNKLRLPKCNPHAQRTQHIGSWWVHWHLGFCKNVFIWMNFLLEGVNIKSSLLTSFGSSPI